MTERERWTVYPLLFFTLAITLRDKVIGAIESPIIECEELIVRRPNGPPAVRIEGIDDAGRVVVLDGKQNRARGVLDAGVGSGQLTLFAGDKLPHPVAVLGGNGKQPDTGLLRLSDENGRPRLFAGVTESSGVIMLYPSDNARSLVLGPEGNRIGMFVLDTDGDKYRVTPLAAVPLATPKPPEKPNAAPAVPKTADQPATQK